jgi:hypothetical protein
VTSRFNNLDEHRVDDDELPARSDRKPERKRMPQETRRFSRWRLVWLLDRRHDNVRPAIARMLDYLIILSHDGTRNPVPLSNVKAGLIGVSRAQKYRLLEKLQQAGWVEINRDGRRALSITVRLPDHASQI